VFDTIEAVGRESFRSGMTSFGLAENGVGYVDSGPHAASIRADVHARVGELENAVVAGKIRVPRE
jgi:basic membrane protein A